VPNQADGVYVAQRRNRAVDVEGVVAERCTTLSPRQAQRGEDQEPELGWASRSSSAML